MQTLLNLHAVDFRIKFVQVLIPLPHVLQAFCTQSIIFEPGAILQVPITEQQPITLTVKLDADHTLTECCVVMVALLGRTDKACTAIVHQLA